MFRDCEKTSLPSSALRRAAPRLPHTTSTHSLSRRLPHLPACHTDIRPATRPPTDICHLSSLPLFLRRVPGRLLTAITDLITPQPHIHNTARVCACVCGGPGPARRRSNKPNSRREDTHTHTRARRTVSPPHPFRLFVIRYRRKTYGNVQTAGKAPLPVPLSEVKPGQAL